MVKMFLGERGVAYEYVDVDPCSWEEKREATVFLKEHGLPLTFPLVAMEESTYICGYRPDELVSVLGLY